MSCEIECVIITGGCTKSGDAEAVQELCVRQGEIMALVGPTGSGKSLLLSDIEQGASGDTPSRRTVIIKENESVLISRKNRRVAQLSQTMNFVVDMSVNEFLEVHASSRGINSRPLIQKVITLANSLTGEPIIPSDNVTALSGGQSRALMIADIAVISDAPVVLIDEIENAGINKLKALEMLAEQGKISIIASHDPLIILKANRRVIMQNGGMSQIISTSETERIFLKRLTAYDKGISDIRECLRYGRNIDALSLKGAGC